MQNYKEIVNNNCIQRLENMNLVANCKLSTISAPDNFRKRLENILENENGILKKNDYFNGNILNSVNRETLRLSSRSRTKSEPSINSCDLNKFPISCSMQQIRYFLFIKLFNYQIICFFL